MPMPLTAILLAAGASTRMGAVKALLPLRGQPAVRAVAAELLKICEQCIVVTGYHHDLVAAALGGLPGVNIARNPQPEQGQLSSLQTGIRALPAPPPDWFLFTPVDAMGIGDQVLLPLRAAIEAAAQETILCIPQYGDRRGHPVAARYSLAEEFLALPATESARSVTRRLRNQTAFVAIADDQFLLDVDRPEDYAALLARLGSQRDALSQGGSHA